MWLILVPLGWAAGTQYPAQHWRLAQLIHKGAATLMIPLMMSTLGVVVASQSATARGELADLVSLVPVYVLFFLVKVLLGMLVGRAAKLGIAQQRSLVFSVASSL